MRFIWLLMLIGGLGAAAPEGTLFIEAEKFTLPQKGEVVKHYPQWYTGVPSGGSMMRLVRGGTGTEFAIPAAGEYEISLRMLRSKQQSAFKMTVSSEVFEFTKDSKARTEKDSSFIWLTVAVKLPEGKSTLTLNKSGSDRLEFDCVVIAPAGKNYEPRINDFFAPFYVQVKSDDDTQFYLHLWGRLPRAPWGIGHFNINKDGIFAGVQAGTKAPAAILKKGDSSPWINIAPYLTEMGVSKLLFYAITSYPRMHENSAFTLYFSTTSSMEGLVATLNRQGKGAGMRLGVDLENRRIIDPADEIRKSMEYARNAGEMPGKRPVRFPVGTGLWLDPELDSEALLNGELEILRSLGLNMLRCDYGFHTSGLFDEYGFKHRFDAFSIFYLARPAGCLSSLRPDFDQVITGRAGRAQKDKTAIYLLMDEPSFSLEHVLKCQACQAGFGPYLKQQNIEFADPKVTGEKSNPVMYYWTVRYRNHILTEFFRRASDLMPGLPTGVNIANALFSNMMEDGCDWFELFGSGALRKGWGEDWINQSTSFQLSGYLLEVLRAACRSKNVPYGIYNILHRTPWEIEAKAFTEIGHGIDSMQFFDYGPEYAKNGDFTSRRSEIYPTLKSIAYTVGGVDEELAAGVPARGDMAMLYSTVSDIWNMGKGNPRGRERAFMYLLLRHTGYRTDVIYEGDLKNELDKYRILYVGETHVFRDTYDRIMDWVKKGNALYLAPGAMGFDEYNRPLWERGKITIQEKGDFHSRRLDKSPKLGEAVFEDIKLPIILVKQDLVDPAVVREQHGKGTVTMFGFLPGTAYVAGAKHEGSVVAGSERFFSCTSYPEGPRGMMEKLINGKKLISSDNYLVEANVLQSANNLLIAVANWNGKPVTVNITVDGIYSVKSVKKGTLSVVNEQDKTVIKLSVEAGDILYCQK